MPEGLILKSASFEPGADGDQKRQMKLESAMEHAGYKVEETPPEPEAEESNEQLTAEQRFSKHIKGYKAQVKGAKEKYDDWDKVVNQDIHIGTAVQLAMVQQENGAEVVYYLGKHPAFAKKLGELSKSGQEIAAIREIERLSARLGAAAASSGFGGTPRAQAPARRPIKPPEDASFAEIAAMPSYPNKVRDLRIAARSRR